MNGSVVFYAAKKTSLCEKAFKRGMGDLLRGSASVSFATDRERLGAELVKCFERGSLTAVIGGLGFSDSRSLTAVIGTALNGTRTDCCKRLYGKTADGYIIRSGPQLLLLLPDDPAAIETITAGCLKSYINAALCR